MSAIRYGNYTYPFSVKNCPSCGEPILVGSRYDHLLFPDGRACYRCASNIISEHMYKPSVYEFQDSAMSVTRRFFGVELEYEYKDDTLPMSTPTGYSVGSALVAAAGERGEEIARIPTKRIAVSTLSEEEVDIFEAFRTLLNNEESTRLVDTRPLYELSNMYDDYIYFKHDGSLHNGVELVTNPTTYIRMFEVGWEGIFSKLKEHNYFARTSCGLHIHVTKASLPIASKEMYRTLANLIVLTQVMYWKTICKLFGRDERQASRYAAPFDVDQSFLKHVTPRELISQQYRAHGRYSAVNLTNDSTVEFRIFPSTLDVNKFFAALELVDLFCEIARETTYKELVKHMQDVHPYISLQAYATNYHKYYLLNLLKEVVPYVMP